MVEPVERDSRGILHPRAGLERFTLERFVPSAAVARFVDRYWLVSWRLPDGQRHRQQVLTHPVVNVVFEGTAATVSGPQEERFIKVLTGRGRAFGLMFRPAGFHPLLGKPMTAITNTVLPLTEVMPGLADLGLGSRLADGVSGEELSDEVDKALAALLPTEPRASERTTAWAEKAATDRRLRRVEDLAAVAGVSVRGLQRAFNDHVGVSPKWVLRRYRLYEAAEQAAHSASVDWAELAADLGYADQAHLTREFTAAVGQPPGRYSRGSAPEL
jgi:AraC-like DNA-binding protein